MLHILLLILKIIGITLAVLLGLVLLLICIVLFVPVRYKGYGTKTEEEISGWVKVSWLFHLFTFTLTYEEGKMTRVIRLLGINLKTLKSLFHKKKRYRKRAKDEDSLSDTVNSNDKSSDNSNDNSSDNSNDETGFIEKADTKIEEKQQETVTENPIQEFVKKVFRKFINLIRYIFQIPGNVIRLFKKIGLTFRNGCDKIKYWKNFLSDERTRAALGCVKDGIIKILKHIVPRKVKGELRFGFEDPASTGQFLGLIYMLYPACGNHISIYPDFEHQVLEGKLELKGRIYLCTLLWIACKVYFDENFKSVLNIFLHKEEL